MATDLKLFIAGEWTEGTGDGHYEVRSPSTGEHIYNVPMASPADIDRAVAGARDATEEMRHWTAFERAELCLRIYDLWQDQVEEIARILTIEQGKPYEAEAIDDIAESGDYFQIAAEDVKRLKGELIPTTEAPPHVHGAPPGGGLGGHHPVELPGDDPHGIRGARARHRQRGDRQAAAEFTSWALLEAAKVIEEAGVPKGAISVIPGDGDIGTRLVTHAGVDAHQLHRLVGNREEDRGRHGPETLDHGDVGQRADGRHRRRRRRRPPQAAVYGAYYNAGQVCTATERVIVVDDVHDEFVEATLKAAQEVRLGDPFDRRHQHGPAQQRADRRQDGPPHRRRGRKRVPRC